MKFEVGKYYKHNCGDCLSIIQETETTVYGKGLLSEDDFGHLMVVGKDEVSATNYSEITKEEWMSNFS